MDRAPLSLTKDGAVALLTIDRAQKRNAISAAMWRALPGLLAEVEADAGIRVLLVMGAGADFSAGADIAEFDTVYADRETAGLYTDAMVDAQAALVGLSKPAVAAISGACVGAGCGMALACDIRLADETARFGITPARLGMSYPLADTRRLAAAVGLASAADLLFSARIIPAEEAFRIGLVGEIFPASGFAGRALAYAQRIAANAPFSLKALKSVLRMVRDDPPDAESTARELFLSAIDSPDFAEGRAAFKARRTPSF